MKFKSKFDVVYCYVIILLCIAIMSFSVYGMVNNHIFLGVIGFLFGVFVLFIFFDRTIYIYDKSFVIKVGFIKFNFKYENIVDVKVVKNIVMSFATSYEKIYFKTKSKIFKKHYISPQEMDKCFYEIINRCVNLEKDIKGK